MKTKTAMSSSVKLIQPSVDDFPRLLQIWETAVRATHHFLTEDDIQSLKRTIEKEAVFAGTGLTCACLPDGAIIGFIGITGDSLDALFIDAAHRQSGVGRALMQYALNERGVRKVDVNEQNEQAIRFYEHYGFRTISRSATDGFGNPFPILHMERQKG